MTAVVPATFFLGTVTAVVTPVVTPVLTSWSTETAWHRCTAAPLPVPLVKPPLVLLMLLTPLAALGVESVNGVGRRLAAGAGTADAASLALGACGHTRQVGITGWVTGRGRYGV